MSSQGQLGQKRVTSLVCGINSVASVGLAVSCWMWQDVVAEVNKNTSHRKYQYDMMKDVAPVGNLWNRME
jgi:hypothetical protein